MVEELGVDGRYAVEQGIVRTRLLDRSKAACGTIRVRMVGLHGSEAEGARREDRMQRVLLLSPLLLLLSVCAVTMGIVSSGGTGDPSSTGQRLRKRAERAHMGTYQGKAADVGPNVPLFVCVRPPLGE